MDDEFLLSLEDEQKDEAYVRITDDAACAYLYLAPREGKNAYTMEELHRLLAQNGVVYGIDDDFLIAMIKKGIYEREICVARGLPATDGIDGYYDYRFDMELLHAKPKIREDGTVDYSAISQTINVKQGMIIAEYIPAKPGQPGKDVRGNDTVAKTAKDLPVLRGRGIVASTENPNLYLAGNDGKIVSDGEHLEIVAEHEVHGDVDAVMGRVEFFGDVHIYGNVVSGVSVRAGKNLVVDGVVEGAVLVAGGDIILKRGVQGNQKAKIACRGDLYADFIEHAQVKVGGNVIAGSIVNSELKAEGKVSCESKKGIIIGGHVHATLGITCMELGSEAAIKTNVHAGVEEEFYNKLRSLQKQETDNRSAMENILQEFKDIEGMVRKLGIMTEDIERRVKGIKERQVKLDEELKEIRKQNAEVKAYIEKNKNGVITVRGRIYVGSVIAINTNRLEIREDNMFMEYRNISGMIAGSVIT